MAREVRYTQFISGTLTPPNHSLQPTPVGAGISAFAGCVTGPAWLSLGRSADYTWSKNEHYQ